MATQPKRSTGGLKARFLAAVVGVLGLGAVAASTSTGVSAGSCASPTCLHQQ